MTIQLTEEQIALLQVRDRQPSYQPEGQKIGGAADAFDCFRHMGELSREHVLLIALNSRMRVIARHSISVGTLDASLVHPREVFRAAILDGAKSVVVAHNHPSGETEPSDEDLLITKRLQTAGKILGIELIDHLIIGRSGYYSMQENGRMLSSTESAWR